MSALFGFGGLLTMAAAAATIFVATSTSASSAIDRDGGVNDGFAAVGIESSFRALYNNYKQCEGEPNTVSCLKLKALKLVDRALSVNNIPISEGISLAKREDDQRSLNEQWTTATINNAIDHISLPQDFKERDEKLDQLLWRRVKQFVESRSLQLKVNKLLFDYGDADADDYNKNANDVDQSVKFEMENATRDVLTGRGKKDKNKGMYMYMMMMKGGMMALAYKGLALLAGKALLVSKIALTLALLVAIKKLFSGGHHSQKTTYEIVKTPIITHSHQYSGSNAQNGHYGNDFTAYDGGPYARSLDEVHSAIAAATSQQQRQRITLKAVDLAADSDADADANGNGNGNAADADSDSRYTTSRIAGSPHARSLTHSEDFVFATTEQARRFNAPYAHLAAYRRQLTQNTQPQPPPPPPTPSAAATVSVSSPSPSPSPSNHHHHRDSVADNEDASTTISLKNVSAATAN